MAMIYEDCLERMRPYLAQADRVGNELDRELYLTLRAATSRVFGLDEQTVDEAVRHREASVTIDKRHGVKFLGDDPLRFGRQGFSPG